MEGRSQPTGRYFIHRIRSLEMETTTNHIKKLNSFFELYKQMHAQKLILAYQGDISQGLTKAFSALAVDSLSKENEDDRVKNRVFHVIVEALQNLSKHSYDHDSGAPARPGSGMLFLAKLDNCYLLTTGNAIQKDKRPEIENMLTMINGLNEDELKELYKKQLRDSRLSDKGGAGLGFIDMAKKTKSKIEFEFIEINDKTEFFLYQIQIKK